MVKGNLYLVVAAVLLGLIIVVFGVLAGTHNDTESYLGLVGPIVTALIALLVVSKQIDDARDEVVKVKDKLDKVEEQTNGQLAKQFADQTAALKEHVTEKIAEATENG